MRNAGFELLRHSDEMVVGMGYEENVDGIESRLDVTSHTCGDRCCCCPSDRFMGPDLGPDPST